MEENLNEIKDPNARDFARGMVTDTSKVTRVEVIDHTKTLEEGGGRAYVFWEEEAKVELSLQDDGRTLKIFLEKK